MTQGRLIGLMQFTLTLVFTVGYFGVTFTVLFGRAHIPAENLRLADTLFGIMSAVLVQQSGYWFARQRQQETEGDGK